LYIYEKNLCSTDVPAGIREFPPTEYFRREPDAGVETGYPFALPILPDALTFDQRV
jgi:hypothetical protein